MLAVVAAAKILLILLLILVPFLHRRRCQVFSQLEMAMQAQATTTAQDAKAL
jgi:hypothetical protein